MDDRAIIERRRADFATAFNREDMEALRDLCAEDIVEVPPNQPPVFGVDAALEWWTVGFEAGQTTLTITPCELYVSGAWAFDWFDWAVRVVPLRGTTFAVDHGSSFWVWRRQHDGVWRLSRAMWNSHIHETSIWTGGIAYFPADESPLM